MKIVNEVSSKKEQYGTVSAQVHDKHGNLLQDVEIPIDSFNRQMWREIQVNFAGANTSLINLTNASSDYGNSLFITYTADGVNNDYLGIVVGSGTNATTYNTVTMQTLIDFGTGNGELFALPSTAEYNLSTRIATLTRSFISVNENSSPISINEVGITAAPATQKSSKAEVFLMVRDVLPSTLSIPYEGTLSVQYKLRIASGNNNYSNVFIRPYGSNQSTTIANRTALSNTNGNVLTTGQIQTSYRLVCDEGNTRRGLNFGTSNAAFNVTQVDLQGKIAHGNGAGQLFYHPTSNTTIQENSTTNSCRFIFTRSVENRSGSPISINEVGIFIDGDLAAPQSFMLDRKILENTVTLQDTNIVTFWWEFCYEL